MYVDAKSVERNEAYESLLSSLLDSIKFLGVTVKYFLFCLIG